MYHYFYKITNNINNNFYYGIHSTNNLNDGYMGSGKRLMFAYKKYGIENFTKEILHFFDSREKALEYESDVVTEALTKDDCCYNINLGGGGVKKLNELTTNKGMIAVKTKGSDKFFMIPTDEYNNNKGLYSATWSGRHHSEMSKDKIRKSMTPTDSKNRRVWVNKNGIVKYIDKKNIEEYINSGWNLGRTGYKPRKGCQGKIIK